LATFFGAAACAQQWEIGGFGGYGWYRNGSVLSPGLTAETGIRNRFAAGAVVTENPYDHFSGEIRYVYQDGHPFVQAPGGVKKDMQGESHTITYDVLFHFHSRERALRPFVAAGAGIKGYVDSGPAPFPQPIPSVVSLVDRDQWTFVASLGGGVRYVLHKRVLLRADFRDYVTKFPKQQIAPAEHNTARGLFQQFTPMIGISYGF
jgi:hypothetical protein